MGKFGQWDLPPQTSRNILPADFGDEGDRPRLSPHEVRLAQRVAARRRPEGLAAAAQRAAMLAEWGPSRDKTVVDHHVLSPSEKVSAAEYEEPHEYNGFTD